MAVSKRTRFEVLRRDNHACRYCGATAPDVKLTVDHVLPTALGGSDDPSNLVACCAPCNSGKASTSPGEHLVADVDQDAIRWAAARKRAIENRRAAAIREVEQLEPFWHNWLAWDPSAEYLPVDWRHSVAAWMADGIAVDDLTDYADLAWMKMTGRPREAFRYLAGIVRNKIADLDKATREILASGEVMPHGS